MELGYAFHELLPSEAEIFEGWHCTSFLRSPCLRGHRRSLVAQTAWSLLVLQYVHSSVTWELSIERARGYEAAP